MMKKSYIFLASLCMSLAALTGCNGDEVIPPVALPEGATLESVGSGSWNDPYAAWQALAGVVMPEEDDYVWVTGYIVGYIDTQDGEYAKLREKSAVFSAVGAPNSNLMIADSPDETDWEKCVPVQLAYGTKGRDLSLLQNPELLHRQVTLRGTTGATYLGVYGLRNCDNYNFGDEGIYIAPPATFRKVSEIESGALYSFVADGKYQAKPLDENRTYGYLYVNDLTISNGTFRAEQETAFTITDAGDGSYTIQDCYGRYVYCSGQSNSFDVAESLPASGARWSFTLQDDGTFRVENVDKGRWMQYSVQYVSYGCYSSATGLLPALYKMDPAEDSAEDAAE